MASSIRFIAVPFAVMAGLVPAIHVDPRDKPGDDELWGARGTRVTLG